MSTDESERDEIDLGENDNEALDDETELQGEALVSCPYCGQESEITLDPGGGKSQQYVEDCPICCRPWAVHVTYDDDGSAETWLEELG
jgi:hypothetical protein